MFLENIAIILDNSGSNGIQNILSDLYHKNKCNI